MRIRQRGIGQIISQKRRGMLGCQRRPAKEASTNRSAREFVESYHQTGSSAGPD